MAIYEATTATFEQEVLKADQDGRPAAVAPENCIFCKFCEMRCPDFAIRIGREEE